MKSLLEDIMKSSQGFVELRYHKRSTHSFGAQKGRVDVANLGVTQGVGIRALVDGVWGFAATSDLSRKGIEKAVATAQANAKALIRIKGKGVVALDQRRLAKTDFIGEGVEELQQMPIAEKLASVIDFEARLTQASPSIQSAICGYKEIMEEKVIITSDGASCSMKIVLPEFSLTAIAEAKGARTKASKSAGVNGGWSCLFRHPALDHLVEDTASLSIDLLKATFPEGGTKTVILAPSVVGLLCHEAIGHTVEADFVKAGSVAQGKIGTRVGSELVCMHDTGSETLAGYAVGNLPFDDEGIETETTTIIDRGILTSYLHNRESAKEFGVAPTGNGRAWLYSDEPIIRMRNTYMAPGRDELSDMIAQIDDGFLIEGAGGGQADANGEFMFGCSHAYRIRNGQKGELLREATLSGIAFDVLKTVDAVSKEFRWDLGTGYCGKGQPAKVDAGGPYIRCQMNIGGRQG